MSCKIDEKVKLLLKERKIEEANKILGFNYYVEGPVLHGLENGRKINFPTVNIEIGEQILPNGVYITKTTVDGKVYKSMTNIGNHPTISKLNEPIIEAHLLDFSEMIYGKIVKIEFFKFIREEKKFPSLNALKEQLHKDLITTRNFD